MSAVLPVLSLLAAVAQAPAVDGAERLRVLARDGPQAALIREVRDRPDDVRDALRQLLALAGSGDTSPRPLAAADNLAAAYAVAWRDSFLLRQVSRFRAWSPDGRRAKVAADSLRVAGNKVLGQSGVVAAVRFRNTLKDTKDAVYIFLAIAVGLAAGVQSFAVAYVATVIFLGVVLVLWGAVTVAVVA